MVAMTQVKKLNEMELLNRFYEERLNVSKKENTDLDNWEQVMIIEMNNAQEDVVKLYMEPCFIYCQGTDMRRRYVRGVRRKRDPTRKKFISGQIYISRLKLWPMTLN